MEAFRAFNWYNDTLNLKATAEAASHREPNPNHILCVLTQLQDQHCNETKLLETNGKCDRSQKVDS